MKRKVLLPLVIGQAPGRPTDAGYLSPLEGPCGDRLASLLGLEWRHFVTMVERVNLVQEWPGKSGRGDKFPRAQGTLSALAMMMSGQLDNRKVVFLGKEVARCFGLSDMRYLETRVGGSDGGIANEIFLLPHPSGVNRWWNDPRNVSAASRAFKVFLSTNQFCGHSEPLTEKGVCQATRKARMAQSDTEPLRHRHPVTTASRKRSIK